jgi:hypothetical protein
MSLAVGNIWVAGKMFNCRNQYEQQPATLSRQSQASTAVQIRAAGLWAVFITCNLKAA